MIKKIERFARILLVFSLIGVFIVWLSPEPIAALTVSATVSSTMVSCTTPAGAASFGTIDNSTVYATFTTTTLSSSGSIFLKVYGSATSDNPALYKGNDLIESPTSTALGPTSVATTTLVAGTEGYGISATATAASGIDIRKDYRWATAAANAIVGGLATSSGTEKTVASSASALSSQVMTISYQAAVAVTTPGGAYADTVTYDCSAS